jgi:hypothetical protein
VSLWANIKAAIGKIRIPRLPVPVNLPPPTTFSEGQRSLFGCLASLAGMAAFVFAVWVTRFFMTHPFDGEALQRAVIDNLGWALIAALMVMALVTVGLLVGGPVGRFKGGIGKDGATFEAEDRDSAPAAAAVAVAVAPALKTAEPPTPTEEPFDPGGDA